MHIAKNVSRRRQDIIWKDVTALSSKMSVRVQTPLDNGLSTFCLLFEKGPELLAPFLM